MPNLVQLFDRNAKNRKKMEAAKAAKLQRKREAARAGTLAERFAREAESSFGMNDFTPMYDDVLDMLEDYRYLDRDELEDLDFLMEFGLWHW